MLDWPEYLRFTLALFTILTPFGAIPLFLSLTEAQGPKGRDRTAKMATLTVAGVLIVSALSGNLILDGLGTSLDSFRVGGGIVLLLLALSMLNARTSPVQTTQAETQEAENRDTVGVVPLGLPLIAGPASISTVIVEGQRGHGIGHKLAVVGVILVIAAVLWLTLKSAEKVGHRLGTIGLNIVNRLFGLMLAAIAIEIMAKGLRGLFPALAGS